MNILVDTHVWLWMLSDPARLPDDLAADLDAPTTNVHLSTASVWEIAVKYQLGRLPLPEPPARFVPTRLRDSGVGELAIVGSDALVAGALPNHHRDPFDRMLVAQAMHRGVPLASADRALGEYDVEIRWA